jgi:hypothetical protein
MAVDNVDTLYERSLSLNFSHHHETLIVWQKSFLAGIEATPL